MAANFRDWGPGAGTYIVYIIYKGIWNIYMYNILITYSLVYNIFTESRYIHNIQGNMEYTFLENMYIYCSRCILALHNVLHVKVFCPDNSDRIMFVFAKKSRC